jgi:hypothetical protein
MKIETPPSTLRDPKSETRDPKSDLQTSNSDPRPAPKFTTPWLRVPGPNGEYILKPGKPVIEEDEIGTREAGVILGLSQRRVNDMCDEGIFAEGRDWWRPPGRKRGGQYHLKRAAVLRMKQ